jgi:hypothetical protein
LEKTPAEDGRRRSVSTGAEIRLASLQLDSRDGAGTCRRGGKGYERPIDAIHATGEETKEELSDLKQDAAKTDKALRVLDRGGPDAYEKALSALRADTREWWDDKVSVEGDGADYDDDYDDEPAPRYTPPTRMDSAFS